MSLKNKLSRKQLTALSGFAAVALAVGGIWWYIAAGTVSTDDARVKGTIVSISAKTAGQLEEVYVNEGDTVQADQVIARIDSAGPAAQVEQARANLAAAQAKLAGLKAGNRPQQVAQTEAAAQQAAASLDNASKNYERIQQLYEIGAVSAQQRDAAQMSLAVAQAQYEAAAQNHSLTAEGARAEDVQAAEAQVQQAAAALKSAQLVLDNTVVKAPVAGVVAVKSADAGEVVAAGQPLFSIVNLSDVWVAANIEETSVGRVHTGEAVDFTVDAYPGRRFKGTVVEVGSATGSQFALIPADNASGNFTKVTQRLPVKIKVIDAGDSILKPGMSADVKIHVRS